MSGAVLCLQVLAGYLVLTCAVPEWCDEASAKAFIASPTYPGYLRWLGIQEDGIDTAHGIAFAIIKPGPPGFLWLWSKLDHIATVLTAGFAHPAVPDNPSIDRLQIMETPDEVWEPSRWDLFPHPQHGWFLEPRVVDGQLLNMGLVVDNWRGNNRKQQLDVYRAVNEDAVRKEKWRRDIDTDFAPVYFEESTWDFYGDSEELAAIDDAAIDAERVQWHEDEVKAGRKGFPELYELIMARRKGTSTSESGGIN